MDDLIKTIGYLKTLIPDGQEIVDADTILKDIIDQCDYDIAGKADDIFEAYQRCGDKEVFEELFFLMTGGFKFKQYLLCCTTNMVQNMDGIKEAFNKDQFTYQGFHFIPVMKLRADMDLKEICEHQYSERELAMSDYDLRWVKHPWCHESFYKACGAKEYDVFFCQETGKLYLPGEHELYGWA
jgi:hypothetical protein